jgi:hypothetical protein
MKISKMRSPWLKIPPSSQKGSTVFFLYSKYLSRFVFPDGSSYQPKEKTIMSEKYQQPTPQPLVTQPIPMPKETKRLLADEREDHQRLANDIIRYNSSLLQPHLSKSPSPSPDQNSMIFSPGTTFKQRPKSGNDVLDTIVHESLPQPRPPLLIRSLEDSDSLESTHHLKNSQEIKKSNHILKSTDHSTSASVFELNTNASIGVDFDVDRAFRRNRSLFLLNYLLI